MKKLFFVPLFTLALFSSCIKTSTNPSGDATAYTSSAVPYMAVNINININSAYYNALTTVGNVVYITNAGYRGILLYRLSSTTIMAYDRTCTFDMYDAGGVVFSQFNGIATCPDCNSIYNLSNGSVNTGPSTIGLTIYNTVFNPNTGALTITN